MVKANAFYAQSGGVTAVINATACGVLQTAAEHKDVIGKVLVGANGIVGALNEELIDASKESKRAIAGLRSTPGGAFGSCRYKLKPYAEDPREYHRLIEVFQAHNIRYFFYNGGGDSQDTANKVSQLGARLGYPLQCIGVPKTVDNDLPVTDCCPGFGSVAKYVAVSTKEAALDIESMCATSTKVFVLEVMGRHAGWIAAAATTSVRTEFVKNSSAAKKVALWPSRWAGLRPSLTRAWRAAASTSLRNVSSSRTHSGAPASRSARHSHVPPSDEAPAPPSVDSSRLAKREKPNEVSSASCASLCIAHASSSPRGPCASRTGAPRRRARRASRSARARRSARNRRPASSSFSSSSAPPSASRSASSVASNPTRSAPVRAGKRASAPRRAMSDAASSASDAVNRASEPRVTRIAVESASPFAETVSYTHLTLPTKA